MWFEVNHETGTLRPGEYFSKYRTVGRHAGDHHWSPFPNQELCASTSKHPPRCNIDRELIFYSICTVHLQSSIDKTKVFQLVVIVRILFLFYSSSE